MGACGGVSDREGSLTAGSPQKNVHMAPGSVSGTYLDLQTMDHRELFYIPLGPRKDRPHIIAPAVVEWLWQPKANLRFSSGGSLTSWRFNNYQYDGPIFQVMM